MIRGRLKQWVGGHPALSALVDFIRAQMSKPVPRGLSWLYTAGTVAAFFFAFQFFTGFLLLMVYVPDEKLAYGSVQAIEHKVPLGALVRQMHAWGASFIVIVLAVHVVKVLWHGSYKRPRELTWVAGFLLQVLTLGFCLSGYLLPWNQLGFWATKVAVGAADSVPVIGEALKGFACGGADVSGATLGRFFALHVLLLPLTLVVLLGVHLGLVIRLGITPRTSVPEEELLGHKGALDLHGSEPFFPRQVYRELLVLNVGFALLVTAAVYLPWELGEPKSSTTPEGIKPEWYFLSIYQFLKYFDNDLYAYLPFLEGIEKRFGLTPEFIGIAFINLVGFLLFCLPFLDRGKERKITRRPIFATVTMIVIGGVVVLGVLGYVSERRVSFMGEVYQFSPKGYPRRVPASEVVPSPAGAEPGSVALATPPEPAAAGGASHRTDGLLPGGTCGSAGCHEEQLAEWKGSIHDQNEVDCKGCHGGLDTKPPEILREGETPETFAHATIKRKKSGDAARPAKKEIPDFCGKCHESVRGAFSPLHLEKPPEGQGARSCVTCHANHAVLEAGDVTYDAKDAYTDAADPRERPFQAARARFRQVEEDIALAGEKLSRLEKTGFPVAAFREELERARDPKLKELRHLVHGLDGEEENLASRVTELREAIALTSGDIEKALRRDDGRGTLVAGVWVVAGVLSGLVLLRLRSLNGPDSSTA